MDERKSATERMEKIVSLCKRRGFIFQSSEIYGGINGFWDYGPLGAELKRNVKELWWKSMTKMRDDVVGLEASIIMHPAIWKASGHVETFADPMVDCLLTKKRFRADQIEPQSGFVFNYQGAVERDDFLKTWTTMSHDLTEKGSSLAKLLIETYEQAKPGMRKGFAELLGAKGTADDFLINQLRAGGFGAVWDIGIAIADSDLSFAFGLRHRLVSAFGENLSTLCRDTFSVLLLPGKPDASAHKAAREFYIQRNLKQPVLLISGYELVKNTTRYNPENGSLLTEPQMFNLMFKTNIGAAESSESVAYLRPETAQAIFAQFKNVLDVSRQKVPFGISQIGKAFRNEINPRNFTFRSREFEQMELEFFIKPDEIVAKQTGSVAKLAGERHPGEPQPNWGWEVWHKYWVEERIKWYESIGLSRDTLEEYWQKKDELAHYAKACVDILFKFPFGAQELEGIAARGNFDLTQHQTHSGKSMEYFDETVKEKYIPHVIEPSAGVDRLLLALICNAYDEEEVTDEKGGKETRVVMRFHPRVAPITVGIFPLLKNKPELVKKAQEVRDLLRPNMNVFYDDSGAIGRRYRRQDEAGTPFGVTIDFDTLGEKGPELKDTVTLRERDSMKQERVAISELLPRLLAAIR